MTACKQSAETLASFVNADLDEPAARAIRAHLLVCAQCLRVVEDLRAIRALAPSLPLPPVPAEERAAILRAITKAAEHIERETPQQSAEGVPRSTASSTGNDVKPH
jgi:hypothetical protein